MINFKNINYDPSIISEIESIGNSCGVVTCYFLSLIYDFQFNIDEFREIGEGMTDSQIQQYAVQNGVKYQSKESMGKSSCAFVTFPTLCENDVCITLSGTNLNNNSPHNSILTWIDGNNFKQLFCNRENCVTKLAEVDDLYLTFYYKDCDIDTFTVWY